MRLYRALRGCSCGSRRFLEDRMMDIITGRAPPPVSIRQTWGQAGHAARCVLGDTVLGSAHELGLHKKKRCNVADESCIGRVPQPPRAQQSSAHSIEQINVRSHGVARGWRRWGCEPGEPATESTESCQSHCTSDDSASLSCYRAAVMVPRA